MLEQEYKYVPVLCKAAVFIHEKHEGDWQPSLLNGKGRSILKIVTECYFFSLLYYQVQPSYRQLRYALLSNISYDYSIQNEENGGLWKETGLWTCVDRKQDQVFDVFTCDVNPD